MWKELEFFRLTEEEIEILSVASGWRCFTAVPVGLVPCKKYRRAVGRRLREFGNVEREGEMWVGPMGKGRKRYGRIIGCMPAIEEEGEDELRNGVGENGEGKDGEENGANGFHDSGICFDNHTPKE